jgi:uncharacterized membrane protein YczE
MGTMKKRTFYTEAAYVAGLLLIALGVVLMEKADFGMSMIVAPAYVLHRWLQPMLGWFTFGAAEYCFQALLLCVMALVLRKFRLSWLFSFLTAVVYGFILDGLMLLGAYLPAGMVWRVVWYVLGMVVCSMGVACMFCTYLSPEVYELLVKEGSRHFGVEIHRFKTGYDCVSCLLALVMSFAVFGKEPTVWLLILELLPVIATAVTSVSYRMPGGAQVRVLSLFSSPLWLIYNACNGSIGGFISDSLSIISIFVGMYKHDRKKKG